MTTHDPDTAVRLCPVCGRCAKWSIQRTTPLGVTEAEHHCELGHPWQIRWLQPEVRNAVQR